MKHIKLPFMPPSANTAYANTPHGRVLSKTGRKFKNEVKQHILRNDPEFLAYFAPNVSYEVLIIVRCAVFTKGHVKNPAVARHKKFDATNRIKLLEDAIVEAAGHDDCQHITVSVAKVDAQTESCDVLVWKEGELGPISAFLAATSV